MQPNPVIKIQGNKALAAFPGFVATFNWLVDFCLNLCGEGEESSQGDSDLRVDRSISDHPVIRGGGKKAQGKAQTFRIDAGSSIRLEVSEDAETKIVTIGAYYI